MAGRDKRDGKRLYTHATRNGIGKVRKTGLWTAQPYAAALNQPKWCGVIATEKDL